MKLEKRDDVFVYQIELVKNVYGITLPCVDGYTVYLNSLISENQKLKAYEHELRNIDNGDYENISSSLIELVTYNI